MGMDGGERGGESEGGCVGRCVSAGAMERTLRSDGKSAMEI